jgi:replication initiation protein RepC
MHEHLDDPGSAEWDEFAQAAWKVALILGINITALRQARETLGRNRAAVAVATVLARWKDGEIKSSAGGYLRAMCERESVGALHLLPSLYGLKERHTPRKSAARRRTPD